MFSEATRPPSRWWWLLVLVLVLLLLRQTRPGQPTTDVGTRAVDSTLRPARVALSGGGGWLAESWHNLTHLRSLTRSVRGLEAQVAATRSQTAQIEELRAEVTRLRRLADLRQALDRPSVSARAIGRSPSPWFRTLTLNVGARRGVVPGCAVVAPEGLVGQVYQVAAGTCRVLCLVDRPGSVGVRLQPAAARGGCGGCRGRGCRRDRLGRLAVDRFFGGLVLGALGLVRLLLGLGVFRRAFGLGRRRCGRLLLGCRCGCRRRGGFFGLGLVALAAGDQCAGGEDEREGGFVHRGRPMTLGKA